MMMEFYDVKTRQKVQTEVVAKTTYQVKGQTRYAVKGRTSDGRNLTKFVSKDTWDETDAPEEQTTHIFCSLTDLAKGLLMYEIHQKPQKRHHYKIQLEYYKNKLFFNN